MRPDISFNFARTRRLDPRITFTRNSIGTYYDQYGILKTSPLNQPRFDHDPTTGLSKGLLIEESRTNLLTRSSEFELWSTNAAPNDSSVVSNTIIAPDGTLTADKIVDSTNTGSHGRFKTFGGAINTTYCFSAYLKAGEYSVVQFLLGNSRFPQNYIAYFDLVAGTVKGSPFPAPSATTYGIIPAGNGWFRVWVSGISDANGGAYVAACNLTNGSVTSFAGTGSSGIYSWGAQVEVGSFPTSFIPTTTATVQRLADAATITGEKFSSWYNQTEGTVVCSCDSINVPSGVSDTPIWCVDAGSTERILLQKIASNRLNVHVRDNNVAQVSIVTANEYWPGNSTINTGSSYKENDCVMYANGNFIGTDTTVTLPTPTTFRFGTQTSPVFLNGHISRLSYWSSRLPNSYIQELTK